MKKLVVTSAISAASLSSMAQDTAPDSTSVWGDPMLPFYLAAAAVLVLLVLVMAITFYAIRVLTILTKQAARQQDCDTQTAGARKESGWKKFIEKMNAAVPLEQEKEIELEHSFDGIRELDNHLPPWWKWLFYGSIGWAAVYLIIFHVTDSMPLSLEEYDHELTMAKEQVRSFQASQPSAVIDENTLVYSDDAATLQKGKSVFMNNGCGGCHRNDGGGNTIGPNLTDTYWLHGGELKDVFRTIKNGVVEKGMPAWGKSMSPQDVRDVAFFVLSLGGTNPPDAKAPQGELFKPASALPADTLKRQAEL